MYKIALLMHAEATCFRLKGGHAKSYILSALTKLAHLDAELRCSGECDITLVLEKNV